MSHVDIHPSRPSRGGRPLAARSLSALLALLAGCVLAPRGAREEALRAEVAGRPFEPPAAARAVEELPADPHWRDLLRHAFLTSARLEDAYFAWKAALSRIDIAATYPNTNVSLGFQYLFSNDNLKAWDRTTLSLGFDPMQNLSFPTKVIAAGRVAFDEARAAGERFRAEKFALQEQVLAAYLDYALLAEKARLQRAALALLGLARAAATSRVGVGAPQRELLEVETAHALAANDLRQLEAELPGAQATLNALVGRDPKASLTPPAALPDARPLAAGNARLLAVAIDRNAELATLDREVAGRRDAVRFAQQQWIPDFNPFAGVTGSIEQLAGIAITLPTMIPRIRAAIAEAEALQRAAEARRRQAGLDTGAQFVAALHTLRDRERQVALFQDRILPLTERVAANARESYAAGTLELPPWIESEQAVLDARGALAAARIARERQLAMLERLAGVDVETLAPPAWDSETQDLARMAAGNGGGGE